MNKNLKNKYYFYSLIILLLDAPANIFYSMEWIYEIIYSNYAFIKMKTKLL